MSYTHTFEIDSTSWTVQGKIDFTNEVYIFNQPVSDIEISPRDAQKILSLLKFLLSFIENDSELNKIEIVKIP
jgi:hypothetical protein